jgi:hypothetical protein
MLTNPRRRCHRRRQVVSSMFMFPELRVAAAVVFGSDNPVPRNSV